MIEGDTKNKIILTSSRNSYNEDLQSSQGSYTLTYILKGTSSVEQFASSAASDGMYPVIKRGAKI